MSGYIEGGYTVTLVTLAAYGAALVGRERAARRRLGPGRTRAPGPETPASTSPPDPGEAP